MTKSSRSASASFRSAKLESRQSYFPQLDTRREELPLREIGIKAKLWFVTHAGVPGASAPRNWNQGKASTG